MAKRISERQRLLTYAMTADKEQIEEALDIFKTALASRFEKKERKKKVADYKDRPTSGTFSPLPASGAITARGVIDAQRRIPDGAAAGKGAA